MLAGLGPECYAALLRCMLVPRNSASPAARSRVRKLGGRATDLEGGKPRLSKSVCLADEGAMLAHTLSVDFELADEDGARHDMLRRPHPRPQPIAPRRRMGSACVPRFAGRVSCASAHIMLRADTSNLNSVRGAASGNGIITLEEFIATAEKQSLLRTYLSSISRIWKHGME